MKKWLKYVCTLLTAAVLTSVSVGAAEENVIIYFQDGSRVSLPASIANDGQALSDYCDTYFPGRPYTKGENTADFNYDSTIAEEWAVSRYGAGSRAMSARLLQLGLVTSVVEATQGEELIVPTRYLTLHGNEDFAHHVAIVSAPRTGEASLREKANGSSDRVATCKAGRIVVVLEYSNASYTKILYEGQEGYIRTDCLIFHAGDKAPMGNGTVQIKGVTDGKSAVTVRATASKSTAKVAELATGTRVIVHEQEDDWYAIEFDGWFGYIQEQYLTMNEE